MSRPKTHRIVQRVVRLSAEEAALIEEKACLSGMTPAAYLRSAGLGKKIQTRKGSGSRFDRDLQKEIWKKVAGFGRNLNQVAVYFHKGKIKGQPEKLRFDLKELREEVGELTRLVLEISCQ
jgi:hypothetical protein